MTAPKPGYEQYPPPPEPLDLDIRWTKFMPIYLKKLLASRTWMLSNAAERGVALSLWFRAWESVPAGSVEDDDRLLAQVCGFGRDVDGFQEAREVGMGNFVLHSDGRWYHGTVREMAEARGEQKRGERESGARGYAKRVENAAKRAAEEGRDPDRDPIRGCDRDPSGTLVPSRSISVSRSTGEGSGSSASPRDPVTQPTNQPCVGPSRARRTGANGRFEYGEDFERAWGLYPRRFGSNPKRGAWKAWCARLRAGEGTVEEMTAGVERYAAHCEAAGKVGSEHVQQAKTFLGPDLNFTQAWMPRANTHEAQREKALEGLREHLARKHSIEGEVIE